MNNDTQISPANANSAASALPVQFSVYGGIIVDIVGANDLRFTAQISPAGLFSGMAPVSPNFLKLCTVSGFDATLSRLGGGVKKCNIRITLSDGDSGSPNDIYSDVFYNATAGDRMPYSGANAMDPSAISSIGNFASQPAGYDFDGGHDLFIGISIGGGVILNCGFMGDATTFRLDAAGATDRTFTGFPGVYAISGPYNSKVHGGPGTQLNYLISYRLNGLPAADRAAYAVTGWFQVKIGDLTALANSLKSSLKMDIGVYDVDPGDQFYDFSQGVGGSIVSIPLFPGAITSFTAAPAAAVGSTPVTLSWTTENCTSVSIDNGVGTGLPPNGSVSVVLDHALDFTMTAVGPDGAAVPVVLHVPWSRPLIVIDYFRAVPATLTKTGVSVLQWHVLNASGVSIWLVATGGVLVFQGIGATTGIFATFPFGGEETRNYRLVAHQSGAGAPPDVSADVTVMLDAPPMAIVDTSPVPAADTVNRDYSYQFTGEGGLGILYHWTGTGLPPGLTLAASTGLLSGTLPDGPTQVFTFQITLSEVGVADLAVKTFDLHFQRMPITIITEQTDLDRSPARAQVPYHFQLQSRYGSGGNTWIIAAGALPDGMSLTGAGALVGTPATYGYWQFTAQVSAGVESDAKSFELMVRLGWDLLDPFHEIFYRVLNSDGSAMIVGGKPLCNDPYPERGGEEVFSQVVVAFEVGTNDFAVKDMRVEGGGLAPEFQRIEDARNFLDLGYWDGKPYPIGGALVIYLPMSVLSRMSRSELRAKLSAILPLGTLPVIRYYEESGEESV